MSKQQKINRIRQSLAELGYHVRSANGYPLYIMPKSQNGVQAA